MPTLVRRQAASRRPAGAVACGTSRPVAAVAAAGSQQYDLIESA
ncbi:hypothetical protein [Massilia genomosp. 1]|nr:hypothetical protein [Massilia genomosp. 1]